PWNSTRSTVYLIVEEHGFGLKFINCQDVFRLNFSACNEDRESLPRSNQSMSQNPILFGFQDDSSMWIIIGVVLVLLFFVVAIVVIGLVIFFVMRKRKKAQAAAVSPDLQISSELPPGEPSAGYYEEAAAAIPEAAVAVDAPPPTFEPATPLEEIRADVAEAPPAGLPDSDFDPSRTVAITRENTVTISYGYIKFISGVLAGEQFVVEPEGTYIGRESSLAQIVVSDPRISKRHLWI